MITPSIVRAARNRLVRRRRQREPQQLGDAHAATRPSSRWTCRLAAAATSASWVMSTIVRPLACSSRKTARTSAPERLSRLPVGSSARISAGSVTRARATATRCCWPPDSSVGSWLTRSPRPSRSSAAVARAGALARGRRPGTAAGVATLSSAVVRGSRLYDWKTNPMVRLRSSGQAVVVELGDRRAGQLVGAGRRVGRGSRGCSSSCSCPSRTGRRWPRTRRAGRRG